MDRRTALRFLAFSATTTSLAGCSARTTRFDSQPKRGLLEDRWPGHYFDTVTARYSLRLQSPSRSLSRASQIAIPIVSSDGTLLTPGPTEPTVRPTRATVELKYDAASQADREVVVTVFWPIDDPAPINGPREMNETTIGTVGFRDIQQFINGTGRFQCDDDNHFYGPSIEDNDDRTESQFDIIVNCEISGKSDASIFRGDIRYRDGLVLYRLAERVVPGIG